jgi:steroid delta-isomerase-like uncharacterized protein
MSENRDLYDEAIRLFNAGDIEGFADAHAEDAVLVTPVGTTRGRAAIRDFWDRVKTSYPDFTLTVNVVVEQGDLIAAEWTWSGTNTGPLVLRDGAERAPTGKRVEHGGMELAHVRAGKIAEYHMYWDGMTIAQQLGLLPQPATT